MAKVHPLAESFFFPAGPTGVLLVHGLTASPSEMRLLGEKLAAEGYTVLAPLLAGHGTTPEALARTRWPDWYRSVEEGTGQIRARCRVLVGVGLSTGALLCLHAAASGLFHGVAALSTPLRLTHWLAPFVPVIKWFRPFWAKNKTPDQLAMEVAAGRFAYDRQPSAAVASMLALGRVVRRELPNIRVPALVIQSEGDLGIDSHCAQDLIRGLGSAEKRLVELKASGHLVTIDRERDIVFQAVLDLVRLVEKTRRNGR